jgi:integrase
MTRRASPGEGRPYQRGQDGRWVVAVRDPDGRRRYLYAWSPAEAVAKRDEHQAGARMGVRTPPKGFTVGRQLSDWLEDRRGKVRSSTWVGYEIHVRIHLEATVRIPLAKLTPADVRRLVREREADGCSPATIEHTLVVLRMALKQAVADGLLPRNVASLVSAPRRIRHPMTILSSIEARQLRAAAPADELGALWELLLGRGLRLGEALGLRWGDVDLAGRELAVVEQLRPVDRRFRAEGQARLQLVEPKTPESRRTMALPAFVVDALVRHREQTAERPRNVAGYVFTSPRGTPLDPRNVSRAWEAFSTTAGLPRIRIHDLRHTCAAHLLGNGATLEDVKRLFGHANIAITSDTYGHLVRERSVEVAAVADRAFGGA